MDPTRPPVTLPELDERLAAYRRRQAETEARQVHHRFLVPGSTVEFSSRVLNDLIAVLLISIAFGATIDSVFNSWPWGIVGMFVLGAAAAIRNVYQTASRMASQEASQAAGEAAEPDRPAAPPPPPNTERG